MSQSQNPYRSPRATIAAAVTAPGRNQRILLLACIASAGICIGSYISAELLCFHFPKEDRTWASVIDHAVKALVLSPLSMTFGVLATLQFCGSHGILVVPGFLMALIGCVVYYRYPSPIVLVIAFIGFVLWSHNNYLSWQAMMSV
jgi:hypothetical protein